jgi:hypothetical protein
MMFIFWVLAYRSFNNVMESNCTQYIQEFLPPENPNTRNVIMYWIQMNVHMQELLGSRYKYVLDSNECSHARIPSSKEFRTCL